MVQQPQEQEWNQGRNSRTIADKNRVERAWEEWNASGLPVNTHEARTSGTHPGPGENTVFTTYVCTMRAEMALQPKEQ